MSGIREGFVIDDDDQGGDIEILDSMPSSSKLPPDSRSPSEDHSPTTQVGPRTEPLSVPASNPSEPNKTQTRINSTFQTPNWGLKTSKALSESQKHIATPYASRSGSLSTTQSSAGYLSSNLGQGSFTGSAQQPIELDGQDFGMGMGMGIAQRGSSRRSIQVAPKSQLSDWRNKPNSISSSSVSNQRRTSSKDFIILDDRVPPGPFSLQERSTKRKRSLEQTPKIKQSEVIDLESLEDAAGEGAEMLQIEHVYEQEIEAQKRSGKKSNILYERRNPSIVSPWERIANIACGKDITLKVNKTVELKDQSFVRIKDILRNTQTQEVRLRGHRLQRARELNGLLEKKLNELVLFLEVDHDDPRIPTEQSTVEVSLDDFERVRNVRFTNQKFPFARNCDPNEFRNKEHAALEGGLTVRWKYTCTYASAADRYHNVYKERTMERLRADECTPGFEISDEDRRIQWRGETVPGGAYRPSMEPEDAIMMPDSPRLDPISFARTTKSDAVPISNGDNHVIILDDEKIDSQACGSVPKRTEKRSHSAISPESSETTLSPDPPAKRIRRQGSDGVEETREGVSKINIRSSAGGSPMA
ncbi:hypothetical protein IFR05_007806, partial [Cadophora sp. M221]